MKKTRLRRSTLIAFGLLLAVLTVPCLLTWRAVQKVKQDQALIAAVGKHDVQSVSLLLKQGADPNAREAEEATGPLWKQWLALWQRKPSGKARGNTALYLTCDAFSGDAPGPQQQASQTCLALLLQAGADPNVSNENRWTPLMLAVGDGNRENIWLLLARGANKEQRDMDEWTALLWATHFQNADAVELLLAQGARVDVKDKPGRGPLSVLRDSPFHAPERSRIRQLLLRAGAKE